MSEEERTIIENRISYYNYQKNIDQGKLNQLNELKRNIENISGTLTIAKHDLVMGRELLIEGISNVETEGGLVTIDKISEENNNNINILSLALEEIQSKINELSVSINSYNSSIAYYQNQLS